MVYRASGRINLAQGELATAGTYVSLVFSTPATATLAGTVWAATWLPATPWPLWLSIPVAMAISAVVAAGIERVVIRPIPERSPRAAVSVSIALLLLINSLTKQVWRPIPRGYPSPFPSAPEHFVGVFGARLRYTTIGTWLTMLAVLGLLALALRWTKAGLAFRAVSSSRAISQLMGIRVGRVLTGGWALAAALGTLAGAMLASRLVLSPDMMIRLLVYGFAAATIGGLTSMGGALLGGLLVGLSQTMLAGYVGFIGGPLSLPVVLLLMTVLLYLKPAGLFGTRFQSAAPSKVLVGGTVTAPPHPRFPLVRGTARARAAIMAAVVAGAAVALIPPFFLPVIEARLWSQIAGTAIVLWGLGLLMGPAGQLSLGHGAFLGLGGYATVVTAVRYDVPPLVGLVPAAVVGFVVGYLVGLPALRVRGQYLAMVTLSLAVVFPMVIQRFDWYTGGSSGPPAATVRPPGWLPLPDGRPFLWLHLVTVAVAAAAVIVLGSLLRSASGRAIRAAADDETAATAMGVDVVRAKTLTFGMSAMLAAVGGGLLGLQTQAVTTDAYDVFRSLLLYAAVVFAGAETLAGGVLGAVVLIGVPWFTAQQGWAVSANLVFGVLLVAGTALFPDGLGPTLGRLVRRLIGFVEPRPTRPGGGAPRAAPPPAPPPDGREDTATAPAPAGARGRP